MKYKHIAAFEEFEPDQAEASTELKNPYTEKELVVKLRLYALASDVPTDVTEIVKHDGAYSFDIFTEIPSDTREFGHKMFHIEVSDKSASASRILTYEGDKHKGYKAVMDTSIEITGENNLQVILWNYIEATQLFDDNVTEDVVDACRNVHTVEDIQKIAKTLITQKDI